jgi:hypothetical protein
MEQHEFEMLWGYLLEFKVKNAFVQLWSGSLIFLAANQYVCIGPVYQTTETLFRVQTARSVQENL